MSAEPGPVGLPRTWRPLGVRLVGGVGGLALVAIVIAVWIGFGPTIRSKFTAFEVGTLVVLGLLAFSVWFALMRCRISATESGVVVVNGYRRRQFEWAQLVNVSLPRGAPWATLDLSDGTTVAAMGIQGSDGPRAITAARELKALVLAKSATPDR